MRWSRSFPIVKCSVLYIHNKYNFINIEFLLLGETNNYAASDMLLINCCIVMYACHTSKKIIIKIKKII